MQETRYRIRLSAAVLAGLLLAASGEAWSLTTGEAFEALKQPRESARFDTAFLLVGATTPGFDGMLARAIEGGFFADSPQGLAAAEFVRRFRAGDQSWRSAPPPPKRPSVLLISVDTLRADHLSSYGHERKTSPVIDALAASGALFERAFSPSSWTLPAHMSLFTSLYPSFHKLEKGGKVGSTRLDPSERTLAEQFRRAGYTTAGLVAHSFLGAEWGFDRGFDLYRRYATRARLQSHRAQTWLDWHRYHVEQGLAEPSFFLFVHFIDPHETYNPPAPYVDQFYPDYSGSLSSTDKMVTLFTEKEIPSAEDLRFILSLYDGEIRYVDAQIGLLLARLEELGLRDSTAIVLTSDHGEEFKDHGAMGHKLTLYGEQLHVPFILALPGRIPSGSRIRAPVSLLDIAPTLLELAELPALEGAQGQSVLPLFVEQSSRLATTAPEAKPRELFAELGPLGFEWERKFYRKAIQSEGLKLIRNHLEDGSLRHELYAIDEDPAERVNLYESRKESAEVRALEAQLGSFIRRGLAYNEDFRQKNEIEIDEQTAERLRALGYMD